MRSQAGVTVAYRNELLYAFDEVGMPYGLDPESLETMGEKVLGTQVRSVNYKAHTKVDAKTGTWLLLGLENRPTMGLHLTQYRAVGDKSPLTAGMPVSRLKWGRRLFADVCTKFFK